MGHQAPPQRKPSPDELANEHPILISAETKQRLKMLSNGSTYEEIIKMLLEKVHTQNG